jgi:hypothetical protein
MTMKIRLGGWKDITGGKVYAGSAWRSLVAIKVYANGAWRDVANFSPPGPSGAGTISATASPNPCGAVGLTRTVVTPLCTVTPSGGTAPYTYAWSITVGTCTINSPTSASTRFTKTGVNSGTEYDATAQCVVTDALGSTATVTVSLFFEHDSSTL